MKLSRSPKIVTVSLVGGTLVLLGGGAVAATLPSSGDGMKMVSVVAGPLPTAATAIPSTTTDAILAPSSTAKVSKPMAAKTSTVAKPSTNQAPITYVVRPGDTLSAIAAWFKLHGYGDLYAANAARIGADPNLIRPGERITIGQDAMSVKAPA